MSMVSWRISTVSMVMTGETSDAPRGHAVTADTSGPLGPPGEQPAGGLLLAEGALVEPQLHQEAVGLADLAAGAEAEHGHDLVAVEVGPQRRELLRLGQPLDPGLEVVIGTPQPLGL